MTQDFIAEVLFGDRVCTSGNAFLGNNCAFLFKSHSRWLQPFKLLHRFLVVSLSDSLGVSPKDGAGIPGQACRRQTFRTLV